MPAQGCFAQDNQKHTKSVVRMDQAALLARASASRALASIKAV